MISKNNQIYILASIVLLFSCCSCTASRINSKPILDVTMRVIIDKVGNNKVSYVRRNGERVEVCSREVEFNGGKDSLSEYLLTKYVNHPSYNYEEYNMLEHFFILFDKNLNIVEVRIMKRPRNEEFYYDSIFIEALKSTAGMWHKTVENKEWHYYMHRQRVY